MQIHNSRVDSDPIARAGRGFPFILDLFNRGYAPPSATAFDQLTVGPVMDILGSALTGPDDGTVLSIAVMQLTAQVASLDATTTKTDLFIVNRVDPSGTVIEALGTLTLYAGSKVSAAVDLRDSSGKGYRLKAGDILRLDSGAGTASKYTGFAITKATPGVVTLASHGFKHGEIVTLSGTNGTAGWAADWTALVTTAAATDQGYPGSRQWGVSYVSSSTFQLIDLNTGVALDTNSVAAASTANAANIITNLTQKARDIRVRLICEGYGIVA